MEMASPPFRACRQNEWLRRPDYLVTKATEINPGIELENIPPKCHQSQLSCWQPALFFRAFFDFFKLANFLKF